MVTNKSYQEYLDNLGIPLNGNVIAFFMGNSDLCEKRLKLESKCPFKADDFIYDSALRMFMYLKSLVFKSVYVFPKEIKHDSIDFTRENIDLLVRSCDISYLKSADRLFMESDGSFFNLWHKTPLEYYALYIANYYKFVMSGSMDTRDAILDTGDRYIAYCNPNNKYMGVFDSISRMLAKTDLNTLKGANKLGCSMIDVRNAIRRKMSNNWNERKDGNTALFVSSEYDCMIEHWINVVMDEFTIPKDRFDIGVATGGIRGIMIRYLISGKDSEILNSIIMRLSEFPKTSAFK